MQSPWIDAYVPLSATVALPLAGFCVTVVKECSVPLIVTLPDAVVAAVAPVTLVCSEPLIVNCPAERVPAKVFPGSSTSTRCPSGSVQLFDCLPASSVLTTQYPD